LPPAAAAPAVPIEASAAAAAAEPLESGQASIMTSGSSSSKACFVAGLSWAALGTLVAWNLEQDGLPGWSAPSARPPPPAVQQHQQPPEEANQRGLDAAGVLPQVQVGQVCMWRPSPLAAAQQPQLQDQKERQTLFGVSGVR